MNKYIIEVKFLSIEKVTFDDIEAENNHDAFKKALDRLSDDQKNGVIGINMKYIGPSIS